MAAEEIHVGDIGTVFELTYKDQDAAVVDISSATTQQLIFKKSNNTTAIKTTTFTTDGTDGKAQYTTVADDLDMDGIWSLQGKVILATGTWYSDVHQFKCWPNL